MGRLRVLIFLLLLAAVCLVCAPALQDKIPALKEKFSFLQTPDTPQPPAQTDAAQPAAPNTPNTQENQLFSWKDQLAAFSKRFTMSNFAESGPVAAPKQAPVPPAKPAAAPKPSVLDIMMEDQRPPLENKLLGPEISALLDDFLARRREYNTQLAQTIQSLFGDEAAQEAIYVLFADETASFANAATCQNPEAFAANQNHIDENTEKQLLQIFKRHNAQLGKPHDGVSPAWKAFFKRVKNYDRVVADGQADAEPQQ